MHTVSRRRLVVGAAIASIGTFASVLVATSPAHAYGDVFVNSKAVVTDVCPGDVCTLYDEIDGTYFREDQGGVAIKHMLYVGGQLIGKVEWHPYGEHLWVYDTRNDGDTIYVVLEVSGGSHFSREKYWPPGTSARVDIAHRDLDFREGLDVRLIVYDDQELTDRITSLDPNRIYVGKT